MRSILNSIRALYSGPYQGALVVSFTLVAALTIGLGAWAISRTITEYLSAAMDEKVEEDIQWAEMFYQAKQTGLTQAANQLALSNTIHQYFREIDREDPQALAKVIEKLTVAIDDDTLEGNLTAAVLDPRGRVIAGAGAGGERVFGEVVPGGDWTEMGLIAAALETGEPISATTVIPVGVLMDAHLMEQARILLVETPQAEAQPYDEREGSAGLGIAAVSPVVEGDELVGAVVVFHLFNNDFTLVDAIKNSTRIDTVTIFFGDLRVSTNVMSDAGRRAVGTRVSDEVNQVVLQRGEGYVGKAFVVNEYYITRYEPLRDYQGNVIGILYVGARQQGFIDFVNSFRQRVALVSAITVLLTFVLATPVSRVITQPLKDLQALAAISREVAQGDLDARAPTTARGEVGQLAGSFNDMLDTLQAAQKQLLQSEKLASLGQLAAGVAHELNNPLATVLLFSDLLRKEEGLPEQFLMDLEVIVNETKRCKKIVSSLLDFARQHRVDAEAVDLNQLIRRVVAAESRLARYNRVIISLDLVQDLPLIQADPGQMQAAISNLMSNGADAMPEGGKLVIRTRKVNPSRIAIDVEDQGVGIPQEDQAKLYTPFFTTKPPGKGIGLGLSIVYGIVKMHRGDIRVDSQLSHGTKFTIELPVRLGRSDRDQGSVPNGGEELII